MTAKVYAEGHLQFAWRREAQPLSAWLASEALSDRNALKVKLANSIFPQFGLKRIGSKAESLLLAILAIADVGRSPRLGSDLRDLRRVSIVHPIGQITVR